jgi:hypothetical protein
LLRGPLAARLRRRPASELFDVHRSKPRSQQPQPPRFPHKILAPLAQRVVKPRIEIHRSFCKGDGPERTFPTEADWKISFDTLRTALGSLGLTAEVFFWDDFHERYLIADIVGVSAPAGFDVTGRANDWSTWGRLGRDDKDKIQRLFDPASRADKLKWRFVIPQQLIQK